MKWIRWFASAGMPSAAIAIGCGVLLLVATGRDVGSSMRSLLLGGFGSVPAWFGTLADFAPLLIAATGIWIASGAGWLNIGAEGQVSVGALAAATVAGSIQGPAGWLPALGLSMVAGALWSLPAPWLRLRRGAHEVVVGLLLNLFARNATRWLASGPLRDPAGDAPRTASIAAPLPAWPAGSDLHLGHYIACGIAAIALVGFAASVLGYETRFSGQAPEAARRAGIAVDARRTSAFGLSGAFCGLAGAIVVLGAAPFRGFPADFHGIGYGFDGMVAALLAGRSAVGVPFAAMALAGLGNGSDAMAFDTGVPRQLAEVVAACVFLAISIGKARRVRER